MSNITTQSMQEPISGISSPETDPAYYKKHSYNAIKNLVSKDMVEHLRNIIAETKGGTVFDTIKKNKYNTAIDDESLKSVVENKEFGALIGSLGYGDSILTDGVVFETDSTLFGFDWHLDITSFKYIYPTDRAFSIWVTLDPIDPEEQDGGLTMLSTEKFSGQDFFKLQSVVTKSLIENQYKITEI